MRRTSKCGPYEKSDNNLTLTKLKCITNKYTSNEKIEKANSSGIYKTRYHNDSYSLLFGKEQLQNFEISCEKFFSI